MTSEEIKVLKRKRILKLQLIELTKMEIEELDRLIEEGERQNNGRNRKNKSKTHGRTETP